MTTPPDRAFPRHPRLRRAAIGTGWLLIAVLTAVVTYALLVLGGH